MLRASLLCPSGSICYPPISCFNPQIFPHLSSFELSPSVAASSRARFHLNLVRNGRNSCFVAQSAGRADDKNLESAAHLAPINEVVETSNSESELVEIGFLSSVHGLRGEICIKSSTDFPELRFCKPGRRWLKQQVTGREKIKEVELVEGRPHPGQKSWILKFQGIDTVDQVKQFVGSTLLAEQDDRPNLDEGEFYTRDLVGMRVLLKATGQLVGTVASVCNSGANDLLHVMLDSSVEMYKGNEKPKSLEGGQTGPLIWIPFVEAIVPDVDLERREMRITPPKGLLELNVRTDDRSKKERRQLEWKERKKHQKRLIAAKKKLCELEQQHVFDGFRYGEKSQRNLLADHIIGVNSKLLQQALQSIKMSPTRWNATEQINDIRARPPEGTLEASRECLGPDVSKEKAGENFGLVEQGQNLFSEGRVSVCLVLNAREKQQLEGETDVVDPVSYLHELLHGEQRFLKKEERSLVPLILVCPAHAIQALQKLFHENDHFGFESRKIWFLEEETLPVVSSELEEPKKLKILMKSPWEILQSPVGSGTVISSLASRGITDTLCNHGIDYLQLCSVDAREAYPCINPMLLGFVNAKGSDLGIQVAGDSEISDESFNLIFSVKSLKRLTAKQMEEQLRFEAVLRMNGHVQKAEKEWIESVPSEPNSFEFRSSIYRFLGECSSSAKICLMEVTD